MSSLPASVQRQDHRRVVCICLFLVAIVWLVFGQTARFDFTNYDDGEYVYENPHVLGGFTAQNAAWAFTSFYASNWHPLTWLTHIADEQIHGTAAGGHHVTNVLLHSLAVVLLFLVLNEMTGAIWRSAFVAVVFAVHPQRVESVAWVAERKDVLSGVFFMLTLAAYLHYIRGRSVGRYLSIVLCFGLGLMSKPSIVTLPFVLLLLDFWPLRRICSARDTSGRLRLGQLLIEKAPLLLMSAASCWVTVLAQHRAIMPITRLPLTMRLANASWSYLAYLWQMIDPMNLAVLYPLQIPPWWAVALSVTFLIAVSGVAVILRKTQPWILVGWLWYLGVLLPMIGLMQVGSQSCADRYTYLSQIGVAIALTWTAAEFGKRLRYGNILLGSAAGLATVGMAAVAFGQVSVWHDSETLWTHTLANTERNSVAHNLLAVALVKDGRVNEALSHFRTSMRINPNDAGTYLHMGIALAKQGSLDEAIVRLQQGLRLAPNEAGPECDLALALAGKGRLQEAIVHYRKSLELDPDVAETQNDLAWLLATAPDAKLRNGAEAITLAERACDQTNRKIATYLDTLGAAYAEQGRFPEAVAAARAALQLVQRQPAMAEQINQRLIAYEQGKPWRDQAAAQSGRDGKIPAIIE